MLEIGSIALYTLMMYAHIEVHSAHWTVPKLVSLSHDLDMI